MLTNEVVTITKIATGGIVYEGHVARAFETEKKGRRVWFVAFDAMTCRYYEGCRVTRGATREA